MKNKWLLLDILTGVLLIIMIGVVIGEIIEVSKVDLSKEEKTSIEFTGLYKGKDIEIDDTFIAEQLSKDKIWVEAFIDSIVYTDKGVLITISGDGFEKSDEIYILDQTLKVGKEFVLETERLKIPVTVTSLEKIGE
ncbi:MAG: hypothetical protein U9Q80_07515 [Bacillota bacterium]|nr:hypothetical protein [Bacillota bacterium]